MDDSAVDDLPLGQTILNNTNVTLSVVGQHIYFAILIILTPFKLKMCSVKASK